MKLFISYRRADSRHITDRIYGHVIRYCDEEKVFRDVDSIIAGANFRGAIADAIHQCNVVLVVIGARWLSATNSDGMRRLDDCDDYVRIEIETTLERGVPLIPVLTEDVSMPSAEELPPSISELGSRQAIVIRGDPDFDHDIERLIMTLTKYGLGTIKTDPNDSLAFGDLGI